MTRRECQEKILDKLLEIKQIYREFRPDDTHFPSTCIGQETVSVFCFRYDEYGKNTGEYILNANDHKGQRTYLD